MIEQHDEEPSVYRETLKARGAHGFHHWASAPATSTPQSRHKGAWIRGSLLRFSPRGVRVVYSTPRATCPE